MILTNKRTNLFDLTCGRVRKRMMKDASIQSNVDGGLTIYWPSWSFCHLIGAILYI